LLESLNHVIARHPETTFVCVHFANNAEELEWVDASLSRYPNMRADLAARIPEIGRHSPDQVRRLFLKHQDRIFFGTDFQVYNRLILGSSGNEPPPHGRGRRGLFRQGMALAGDARPELGAHDAHSRRLEDQFHRPALCRAVLRKVYFDNARKLLAGALPPPSVQARRLSRDLDLEGHFDDALWQTANQSKCEMRIPLSAVSETLPPPERAGG